MDRYRMIDRATPPWARKDIMQDIYRQAFAMKAAGLKVAVDHIVPIRSDKVCGLRAFTNLRIITAKENSAKCNRHWPDMP